MAVIVDLTAPTGKESAFIGEPSWVAAPGLAVSKRLKKTHLIANLGYRWRPSPMHVLQATIGSEIYYRTAVSYDLNSIGEPTFWRALVGVYGQTAASHPWGIGSKKSSGFYNSMEALGGLVRQFETVSGVLGVTVGVGVGLLPGYGSAGFRFVLGVDFMNRDPFADSDGDGVPNAIDACPDQREDFDGFEDQDGCPDPDNDHDGILDDDDECPNVAEDIDGYQDQDGCPEGGPPKADPDSDGDGIPDKIDKCPNEPEDYDGFQDEDGCPDPDNDGDGLPDLGDMCPNDYEDQATSKDHDGCPDNMKRPELAELRGDIIVLKEPLRFVGVSPSLAARAGPVLDQVAGILKNNGSVSIVVEVAPQRNTSAARSLAVRRAQTIVTALARRGIDRGRLSAGAAETTQASAPPVTIRVVKGRDAKQPH